LQPKEQRNAILIAIPAAESNLETTAILQVIPDLLMLCSARFLAWHPLGAAKSLVAAAERSIAAV